MAEDAIIEPGSLELIHALLKRANLRETADAAFRKAYPSAPQQMIETATFHVLTEGVGAMLEWVAEVERFLRDPGKGISSGATYHVLYHLYNWQQFEALLPDGRAGMLEWVNQLKESLDVDDLDAAKKECQRLEDMLQGGLRPPTIHP